MIQKIIQIDDRIIDLEDIKNIMIDYHNGTKTITIYYIDGAVEKHDSNEVSEKIVKKYIVYTNVKFNWGLNNNGKYAVMLSELFVEIDKSGGDPAKIISKYLTGSLNDFLVDVCIPNKLKLKYIGEKE